MLEVKERYKKEKYMNKSFSRVHYEDMWSSCKACKNIIKDDWEIYGARDWENPMQQFQRAAKRSLVQLKIWSKEEFRGRKRKLDKLMEHL